MPQRSLRMRVAIVALFVWAVACVAATAATATTLHAAAGVARVASTVRAEPYHSHGDGSTRVVSVPASTKHPADVAVVVNGRSVHTATCPAVLSPRSTCSVVVPAAARDEIAVYSRLASLQHKNVRSWRRLTNVSVVAMENHSGGTVLRARPRTASPASARVGVLYETWHAYAANAMATVQAKGGTQLTVEQLIRSNGQYNLSDVWDKWGVESLTDGFYWQSKPKLGFYCIYRARPGEKPLVPNCANITGTLTAHANMLVAAGVDYVVTDSTNLGTPSAQADVIQVRPTEVLFEEWAALRARGINTPQIAVWQVATAGSTLWQNCLALYNNASYSSLIPTDATSGKQIFFVPHNPTLPPDASIVAAIQSNGGRNNVVVVSMWADFPATDYGTGLWGFFSPCTAGTSGDETTSVANATGCRQHLTTGSPLGTAMAVSPSYQINYGSLPFGAPGKLSGGTLQKQFAAVLAAQPSNVFISSFNEFIAQPQPNPFNSPRAFSFGMPWDTAGRDSLWVDTYGWGFGRDIEPSVEGGSAEFDMVASCLRVMRLLAAVPHTPTRAPEAAPPSDSSSGCTVQGEVCCEAHSQSLYSNVWSLRKGSGRTWTTSATQVATLTQQGWTETCTPFAGQTAFCYDAALLSSNLTLQGPFIVHSTQVTATYRPLYRCPTPAGPSCLSTAIAGCSGAELLGYVSPTRSTDTPRGLRTCSATKSGSCYAVLDGPCAVGDSDAGVLGFVV